LHSNIIAQMFWFFPTNQVSGLHYLYMLSSSTVKHSFEVSLGIIGFGY
jgi:hypothetical protein